ncbi:Phytochelatin synthase-domain-containing protein [Cokeromyces recurvatus]|uniref:Phytochelatin synthase-domain-containing protein n=1 Tax=Cokeromyces recurvatus TaxID=90255 RepID=UPI00221FB081|nr:Phytochelatin synthase-domain-containing protein [Cokeromyces recurvatus]KAI7903388.1 Phytochelatin synthase-domain-containing protein [Cokeromyces recurvatus]
MLKVQPIQWLRYRTRFQLPHSYQPFIRSTAKLIFPLTNPLSRSIGTQTENIETDSHLQQSPTIKTIPEPSIKAAFQDLLGVTSPEANTHDDLKNTFYQRELPKTLVRFASPEGKKLFREAMDIGHAEGFFPLTGNFTTQSEPAFCGPSSLAMVLNALEVDPKRRWKGNWRWYSDEFLHCCSSKEEVKVKGITFDNFACLAKCHCDVQVNRAFDFTFEKFVKDVEMVTSTSDKFMVVSFSRKVLGQTGDGHFSPIGAYNAQERKVLILDTARYKYPSYWCPIEMLFESMNPIDKETGRPRGYFVLSYDVENPPVSLCKVKPEACTVKKEEEQQPVKSNKQLREEAKLNWSTIAKSFCQRIPENLWLEKPRTLEHVVRLVLRNVPKEYTTILANQSLASFNATNPDKKAEKYINELLYDTTKSPLYPVVIDALYPERENHSYTPIDYNAAFATLFVLGSPRMLYTSLPKDLQDRLDKYRRDESMSTIMKHEVQRISNEVVDLTTAFCTCGPNWTLPDPSSNDKKSCCSNTRSLLD